VDGVISSRSVGGTWVSENSQGGFEVEASRRRKGPVDTGPCGNFVLLCKESVLVK
jgi:hypothetical protein